MADPRGTRILADSLTPNRAVSVTWDITETQLLEPAVQFRREGDQIKPSSNTNCILLQSGNWVLKPLNSDFAVSHETTAGQAYVMRLSEFNAASVVAEVPYQRKLTELPGLTIAAGVASSGDYYFTKRVTAGNTWSNLITSALPAPTLPTGNYAMQRLMEGPLTGMHEADTGYMLKFLVPGAELQHPDNLLTFYFGGPLIGDASAAHRGFGEFALTLTGDARAYLFERIDSAWTQVATWRYHTPRHLTNAAMVMRILPHLPRYIEFSSLSYEAPTNNLIGVLSEAALLAIKTAQGERPATYTHEITNRGADANYSHGLSGLRPVTGAGRIAFDIRQDLRLMWQVARLAYPASGMLVDRPFTLPAEVGMEHIVSAQTLGWDEGDVLAGTHTTTQTVTVTNADGTALTPATENYPFGGISYTATGWQPPGGLNTLAVNVVLATADPYLTPSFRGYEVRRNADFDSVIGSAVTGGTLREITITGPAVDPDHESARIEISDLTNALTLLRTRGRIPVRIETTYDAADQTKKSVLFEGYSGQIMARHRGVQGRVYPSPDWRDYDASLMGKWDRLSDRFAYRRYHFESDRTSPAGQKSLASATPDVNVASQSWKVTDAIRYILMDMGFGDSQLDIFDDPIRLFAAPGQTNDYPLEPPPGTSIPEMLTNFARDYLNAFLVWDANAGTAGMWRLLRPPTGTETPLWNFVTTAASGPKLVHRKESYAALTSPIFGRNMPFETWVVPPEGNVLTVSGATTGNKAGQGGEQIRRTLSNRTSWDAPGFSAADPNSLDYLGRIVPIEYVDTSLSDQPAVDFVARRVFNLACRGRKFVRFTAELVLVSPSDSVYTTRTSRPLRTADTVTIDGDRYIVHQANGGMRKQHLMLSSYECELFRPDITWHGWA